MQQSFLPPHTDANQASNASGGLCAICIRLQSVILDTGWCAPDCPGLWRSCCTSTAGVVYHFLQSTGTHIYSWEWPTACLVSRSEAELCYSPEFPHAPLSCSLPSRLYVPSALRLSRTTALFAFTPHSHKAPPSTPPPSVYSFFSYSLFFLLHFLSFSSLSLIFFSLCLSSHARGKRLSCLKARSCQTRCVEHQAQLMLHVKATQHTICHCCLFQCLISEDPGACIYQIWNAYGVCR